MPGKLSQRFDVDADDGRNVVEVAGRVGLLARAAIYLVVAALAVPIALGSSTAGEEADARGAIEEIADRSFGAILLVLLAVGFGGYAAWRAVRAVVGEGRARPEPHERAADIGRATLYAALLASTVEFLTGNGSASGSEQSEQAWTARLMQEPWGRWLVGAVGVGLVAAGVWLTICGIRGTFAEDLERRPRWTMTLGRVAHAGRGAAFALIGGFVLRAAWQFDANEPIGLDAALHDLARTSWGTVVVLLVAAGLAAFGAYSLAETKYRRVLEGRRSLHSPHGSPLALR